MKTTGNIRAFRRDHIEEPPLLSAWTRACNEMCMIGGFRAQTEGLRFQIRKSWIEHISRFKNVNWLGWVPGIERCCRLAPECAREFFDADLSRWQALRRDEDAALPALDAPVKVLFEPRGRITIPDQLALALNFESNKFIFIRPRRGYLEAWMPEQFSAYCAQMLPRLPILGEPRESPPGPTEPIPCEAPSLKPGWPLKSSRPAPMTTSPAGFSITGTGGDLKRIWWCRSARL